MSIPNIPNMTPLISITTEQTIPLLLASIALEELALAHIMNAEAEKLQFVLGTLDTDVTFTPAEVSLEDLLDVNTSVQRTLRDVIKKEMLLEFKFENVLDLITETQEEEEEAVCECLGDFIASNDTFERRVEGVLVQTAQADLVRISTSNGRVRICGQGEGAAPCDPTQQDLFELNFPDVNPTITFVADQYFLTSSGALGTCCVVRDDEGDIIEERYTISGIGTRNGIGNTPFVLELFDRGGNDDEVRLTLNGTEEFRAEDLPNGNVIVNNCPDFDPPDCV